MTVRSAVTPSAVGAHVRACRESTGVSQAGLAAELGVTQTAVSYWESGKRSLDVVTLLRIAAALRMEAVDLLPPARPDLTCGSA